MQRDSHASLEWIFFSKKKKRIQASSPWYCPQMASFQQWVSFVPRWYLGRALTAEGASWFSSLGWGLRGGLRSIPQKNIMTFRISFYFVRNTLYSCKYTWQFWKITSLHKNYKNTLRSQWKYIPLIWSHLILKYLTVMKNHNFKLKNI